MLPIVSAILTLPFSGSRRSPPHGRPRPRQSIRPEGTRPLIINADTVLPRPIILECFQPVPRRVGQRPQGNRRMDLAQLAACRPLDLRRELPRHLILEDAL